MKKTLFLIIGAVMLVMTSCIKKTTYEIYNGTSGINMYDVKSYEYAGSNAVSYYDVGFLNANSTSGAIEASKESKQVKIAFKFYSGGDVYTTADYYSLNIGSHTMVLIEDDTQVIGNKKDVTTVGELLKK